mgnify:CR=1 FL=1
MTGALEGTRIMAKDVPSLVSTYDPVTSQWSLDNGWRLDNNTLYYESYFDLSGYELSDLTTLIDMIMLQDSNAYFLTGSDASSIVRILDIVSEEKLSPDEVAQLSIDGEYPSTPMSNLNYDQVKYCTVRGLIPQTDLAVGVLAVLIEGPALGTAMY